MAEGFVNWIASYPKSGNTWVRALIDAYFYQDDFSINTMDRVLGEPPVDYYRGLWTGKEEWELYDYVCMRQTALKQMHEDKQGLEPFLVKTHVANVKIHDMPLVSSYYTNKAIYIIRDPRDVLVSSSKYFREDLERSWYFMKDERRVAMPPEDRPTDLVMQPIASWGMHVKSWLGQDGFPVLLLRYEDLLEDTYRELTRIITFLDIPLQPLKVKKAVELTRFHALQKAEEEHGFRDNLPKRLGRKDATLFFREGRAGQWREELPEELAEEVYNEYKDIIERIWGATRAPVQLRAAAYA